MAQKFLVSGEEVFLWRRESLSEAIASGIPTQELDWLLQEMADLDALSLRLASFRDRDVALTCSFLELKMLWERRIQERVPVQYLAQVTRWRDFKLMVAPGVLIPRPETELIIEIAQRATCPESPRAHWVDLGTGTGAIALGLTNIFPQAAIHAAKKLYLGLGYKIIPEEMNWYCWLPHYSSRLLMKKELGNLS